MIFKRGTIMPQQYYNGLFYPNSIWDAVVTLPSMLLRLSGLKRTM